MSGTSASVHFSDQDATLRGYKITSFPVSNMSKWKRMVHPSTVPPAGTELRQSVKSSGSVMNCVAADFATLMLFA